MNTQLWLKKKLIEQWEKIALQGGELERILDSCKSNVYIASHIYIYSKEQWIEISVHETIQDEEFKLSIKSMETPPIPETNPIFRPPRKIAEFFPDDCPLDELIHYGVKEIAIKNGTFLTNNKEIIADQIEIISKIGNHFILFPYNFTLLDIEISYEKTNK